ncbi:hypothetical protein FHU39_000935 [Flexivirga oryzae]|uniref:Uncharacterized protein n=1 Tax=Flexivirga oryzae TaxID=1794944 RepID=A0A839N879_9MICO|nr:hypothetical protein [Flexivirga oryzae]
MCRQAACAQTAPETEEASFATPTLGREPVTDMPKGHGLRSPMPFCPLCFRYLTPAQARAHTKHARVIRWPKHKKRR